MASRFPLQLSCLLVASTAVAMIAGPLILAVDGGWPCGRSFAAELGSSLGIAALGMLGLLLVLASRLQRPNCPYPRPASPRRIDAPRADKSMGSLQVELQSPTP